jgi:hypothetical protein
MDPLLRIILMFMVVTMVIVIRIDVSGESVEVLVYCALVYQIKYMELTYTGDCNNDIPIYSGLHKTKITSQSQQAFA